MDSDKNQTATDIKVGIPAIRSGIGVNNGTQALKFPQPVYTALPHSESDFLAAVGLLLLLRGNLKQGALLRRWQPEACHRPAGRV